ncbi:hypothetical protein AKJ48_01805 [candidate division MSBL1 archaeon SCGC-AAA261O19]|uniref:HTH iclR-type domain-containing protein n=2 Tax=candidate division MSBL1 TaxID=215777 RepID=A0A133UZY0_9EURY|nr:hypothetical protein AKJ42_02565 [candidate division MSBL1 archaeon SCGC-AAA261C02]KXB04669.1 hypothetical protein AKJ48_01805 [candidate division MSBL1 archaeon SCGC-AAA261O19]
MAARIAKFIPASMRSEIVQELINIVGIRPLSRKIGVNPKTVYNYKHGTAKPGDETMSRILAVMKEDQPHLLERHLERLQARFSNALEAPIELEEPPSREKPQPPSLPSVPPKEVQRPPSEPVARRPTPKTEVSLEEIFDKIGVSTSFDRMKAKNFLAGVRGEGLSVEDIVERSGLSRSAVEKYLQALISENLIEEGPPGTYTLSVRIREED